MKHDDGKNNYTVYIHTCPNMKKYIGRTKTDVKKRWRNGRGYKGSYFYEAITEFGWDNIRHEIIASGLKKEDAKSLEENCIIKFNTINPDFGYNIMIGNKLTDEQRQKRSERSPRLSGEAHPMYGRHHSEETKLAWSKMRSSEKNPLRGRTICYETRKKMSEGHINILRGSDLPTSKSVICITTNKIFGCIREAADFYNTDSSNIVKCCKGKIKFSGRCPETNRALVWRYYNEND